MAAHSTHHFLLGRRIATEVVVAEFFLDSEIEHVAARQG
jgi:hypothetical protein